MKRVFLIVLDSCGCGAAPDSEKFGDIGVNTLRSCATSKYLSVPNMISLGLSDIPTVDYLPTEAHPTGAYGRIQELSAGKDTTIGHWEIAGLVSPSPCPPIPTGSRRRC